ncbi:hypothetical protein [uncultured Aquimarina sp.]|uniref:hypothetical protein n=1 Tax=uncultured Aquimarina sp. TaxID=575652 RepID=UPI0026201CD0|nr:hypothetical protein [uncultured Aquimarina sp.]
MKTTLTLVFAFFLISFPNEIIGTYQIIDDINWDILEIKKDGTYTYKERGDSCWLWNDFSGEWELKNEILTLSHVLKTTEDEFEIKELHNSKSKDSITIMVNLKNGKPIPGIKLEYYSADEKNYQSGQTDLNGALKFVKNSIIYSDNDDSFIDIVGVINNKEVSTRLISSRNSDEISIFVNIDPKPITKNLKHKFKFENGLLISLESLNSFDDKKGKKYKKNR